MDAPRTVMAVFGPDLVGPVATGVTVAAYGTGDRSLGDRQPSTSTVQFGTASGMLNSSVDTELVTSHEIFLDGLTPESDYFFEVNGLDDCQNPYSVGEQQFNTGPVVLFADESFFAPNLDRSRWDWDDPTGGLTGLRVLDPGTAAARVRFELLDGVAYDSGSLGAAPSLGQAVSVGNLDLAARFMGSLGLDGQRRGFQLREGADSLEEIFIAVEGASVLLLSRTTTGGVVEERSQAIGTVTELDSQLEDLTLRVQFQLASNGYLASVSSTDGTVAASLFWSSSVLGQRVALTASNRPGTTRARSSKWTSSERGLLR